MSNDAIIDYNIINNTDNDNNGPDNNGTDRDGDSITTSGDTNSEDNASNIINIFRYKFITN